MPTSELAEWETQRLSLGNITCSEGELPQPIQHRSEVSPKQKISPTINKNIVKIPHFQSMRKFPIQLGQQGLSDAEKPKTAMVRMQAPLRQAVDCGNSPAQGWMVRPFELQSLDENYEPKPHGLRQAVREELELLRKQQQRHYQEGFKEIRAEISQLRDTLEEKPDRKALDNYLNARLQQLSLEAHSKNTDLKGALSNLEKSLGERILTTQYQIDAISKQLSSESKASRKNTSDVSKMQMMESNIEFIFERLETLAESRLLKSGSKQSHTQHSESPGRFSQCNTDHFDREIRSLRAELKSEMSELTNGFCSLEEQLQEYSKQLKHKISTNDLNEALQEFREKSAQSSLGIQRVSSTLYELQEERENTERLLSRLQERVSKFQTAVESTLPELKCSMEEQLAELSSEIEERFARIISSYNGNFQEIDENSHQLKEMISEILSINSVLTQKLVGAITNKLDCLTFESTIEHLNEQITSTLCLNNRKIRQLGDKEFEVEHELKSLKAVLGGLKHDYQRNYNRLKDDDQRSSFGACESDRKSIRGRRPVREVSPLLMSPLLQDTVRSRRNEGLYEAAGGRYNNSHERRPYCQGNRSVSELQQFQPELFHMSSYSKMPTLSDELASLS